MMHKSVRGPLRGVSGFVFLIVNTLLWAVPIYILGLVKPRNHRTGICSGRGRAASRLFSPRWENT